MTDALLLVEEGTAKTWQAVSNAYRVRNFQITPGEGRLKEWSTGQGKMPASHSSGARLPTAQGEMVLTPEEFGLLLVASGALQTTAVIGATAAYTHAFNYGVNDDAAWKTLSGQVQRTHQSSDAVEDFKGAIVTRLEFSVDRNNLAMLSFSMNLHDVVEAGGTFVNGDSAQAKVASPTYNSIIVPFKWSHFSANYGGTPAQDGTSKVFTVSGGTALSSLLSWKVAIEHEITHEPYLGAVTGDRMTPGKRTVSGEMEIANDAPGNVFIQRLRANTQECLHFLFTHTVLADTGQAQRLSITLPNAVYMDAPLEPADSEFAKSHTVTFEALEHASTGEDVSIAMYDTTTADY